MKTTTTSKGQMTTSLRLICAAVVAASALAACGGGGGGGGGGSTTNPPVGTNPPVTNPPVTNPPVTNPPVTNPPVTNPPVASNPTGPANPTAPDPDIATLGDAFDTYWNYCATPRTGTDPYTGKAYPDKQGTLRDELTFLRAWSDQYYLWYNDIPTDFKMADFAKPVDYFSKLRSSRDKDAYHFTYPSAEWDKLSNSGIELGYGFALAIDQAQAPRNWMLTIVEANSPASRAGLRRGDQVIRVDGVDLVNATEAAQVATLNAGLFPSAVGEQHSMTVKRAGVEMTVTLTAQDVQALSVKNTKVIETATGKVGYLSFENHNAVAERQLINSFNSLKAQGVNDLVLDMRYNGGGLLNIASELAYMVAGPTSQGQVFERLVYNNKIEAKQSSEIIRFEPTAYGFAAGTDSVAKGTALPYLGLRRVTVLTSPGTCSASEAVINGLRGIDVEVNVIGGQTCGKPYGFTPVPNCGTTYFSVEFQGVNAKGFGDYANGIAPTCAVADDLTRELGDQNEAMLATALSYRANGVCPAQARSSAQAMKARYPIQSAPSQIAVYHKAR
ncbi:S41 family peptidase [Massilia brevitalea]|uniref:S41 family peptidase n=1 Tax=Massilia brevitalea TaxID=442526 RepID=UPI0027382D49|nr:S41 family peptidase [Massilia brevitalea]